MADDRSLLATLLARIRAKVAGTAAADEAAPETVDLEEAARDSDVVKLTNLILVTAFKDQARVLLGPGKDVGNLRVTLSPRDGSLPRKPDWAMLFDDAFDPDLYLPVVRRLCVMTELEPTSGERGIVTLTVGGPKMLSFRVAIERDERGLLAVVEPFAGPGFLHTPPNGTLKIARTNADRLPPKELPTLWQHAVRAIEGDGDVDVLFCGLEELSYAWVQLGEYERALECARRAGAVFADVEDSPWRQVRGLGLLSYVARLAGDEETERTLSARVMHLLEAHGPRTDLLDAHAETCFDHLERGRFDVALSSLESVKRLDVECFGAPTTASLIADACAAWIESRGLGVDERIGALEARARALFLPRSPAQHRTFMNLLGRVARRAGMTTDAEHYARASISARAPWRERFGATLRLALVLADAGKLDEVEKALAQARALVPAGIVPEPRMRAREALVEARLDEERGRLDAARARYAEATKAFMADLDLVERARKLGVDVRLD